MINCQDPIAAGLADLLLGYKLHIETVELNETIPGTFWGDSEAGLIDDKLFIRTDTPLHSALHEACHFICMDPLRRNSLDTNAGGDYDEENAVCYLQIILANMLLENGTTKIQQDMDEWGYSFRLGSTKAWFEEDAKDAKEWLLSHKIIDNESNPTWTLRQNLA